MRKLGRRRFGTLPPWQPRISRSIRPAGCQALAPCRIVTGAVVAPSWMARRQASPEIPSVSGIYPTAHREKSSSASVFTALAWRAE